MKNKLKKITMLMVAIFCIAFAPIVNAQSGVTLKSSNFISSSQRYIAKFYTTKGYAYCISPGRKVGSAGQYFNYKNDENDGGIRYILSHSGTSDNEYVVSQLALWRYHDNYSIAPYRGTNLESQAINLVNEAKKHKNDSQGNVSISVNSTGINMSLTSDGKYYQSSAIVATVSGATSYTLNVSGCEGIQIIVAGKGVISGNSTTINSGTRFRVRIPVNSVTSEKVVTMTMKATSTKNTVKRYSAGSSVQEMVVLEKTPISATKQLSLRLIPKKRVCEFYNGKYYGKDGKIITEERYHEECETNICREVNGKFYGKNGKLTTEEKYREECETNICREVNGKFYGKDGKLTTEEKYREECETNICREVNGKFYGKNGTEVSEETYKEECEAPAVVVPNTGSNKNIFLIIGGVLLTIGTITGIKKYKKNI